MLFPFPQLISLQSDEPHILQYLIYLSLQGSSRWEVTGGLGMLHHPLKQCYQN